MALRAVVAALLLAAPVSGQVVFSRRVYQERGASYEQIWRWDPASGALKQLTHSARNHFAPACSDGKMTFVSSAEKWDEHSRRWSFDPVSGEEREVGPEPGPPGHQPAKTRGCTVFAKSGNLEACGNGEELSVSRGGQRIGHFNLEQKGETPILYLVWSPGEKWLLVGELGLDTNSTNPQFDYSVVEAATMKVTKVASASQYDILWVPGREELVYVTVRDLAPWPGGTRPHSVWVEHLMKFDPATGKSAAITTGLSDNFDAAWCGPL